MNRETFATLLRSWKEKIGSLDLKKGKAAAFFTLLTIQEQQTGVTLDPALVVRAAAERPGITLTDLGQCEGDSFCWVHLQQAEPPLEKTRRQIKRALDKQGTMAQHEEIYQAYPRHVGKGAALKAVAKAIKVLRDNNPDEDAVAFLLEKTRAYASSPAGNKGKYTPHPATWFNQCRFFDDEAEWFAGADRVGTVIKRRLDVEEETPANNDDELIDSL